MAMEDTFVAQAYPFRAASWVASLLGAVALALTISGMYGVMSYLVSQRTKEIGIRMALGATPGSVVRAVLGQSMRLAALGLSVGLFLSFGASKVLGHVLLIMDTYDVPAYLAGVVIISGATLAAAFFPSQRAVRVNPADTLRAE
jgi:ABC-type antimicrobial peptide transport system permease subunit